MRNDFRYRSSNSIADSIRNQRSIESLCDSVSAETEDRTDREEGGSTVPSEKGRDPDYGRTDYPDGDRSDLPALYQAVSQYCSGTLSDCGVWDYRFSG